MTPDMLSALSSSEEIINEARQGRMVILVDDEDRENEGDLVIPGDAASPEAINFMIRFGRGLVCLALPRERVEQGCSRAVPEPGARRRPRSPGPPPPSCRRPT